MKVAEEQSHTVLRMRRRAEGYSTAAMVDVDEDDVGYGESGRRKCWWRRNARRFEGGVGLVRCGDLVVHCRKDLLHSLFKG